MRMMLSHLSRKLVFVLRFTKSTLDQQGQCALVGRVCDGSGRFKVVCIFWILEIRKSLLSVEWA